MPPGGTQHRQPRAERYTDAGHGFGGLGGTPCHWRNATSTPRAERYTDAGHGFGGLGGTPCHWRNATSTPRAERYTDAGAWPRWPRGGTLCHQAERNIDSPGRNAIPMPGMASVAWAERHATGGTQHRRPGRNAIPMPGHGLGGLGGTQHRDPSGTLCHWYW